MSVFYRYVIVQSSLSSFPACIPHRARQYTVEGVIERTLSIRFRAEVCCFHSAWRARRGNIPASVLIKGMSLFNSHASNPIVTPTTDREKKNYCPYPYPNPNHECPKITRFRIRVFSHFGGVTINGVRTAYRHILL